MKKLTIGFALTGSFCTFERALKQMEELIEEQTGDEGYLTEYLNDKDKVDNKAAAARMKELDKLGWTSEESRILERYFGLLDSVSRQNKAIKVMNTELEDKVREKYPKLTDEEILELLVNRKWYYTIFEGIKALYVTASHNMANRIIELAERYEYDLPFLAKEAEVLEAKVKAHLERMGFQW